MKDETVAAFAALEAAARQRRRPWRDRARARFWLVLGRTLDVLGGGR